MNQKGMLTSNQAPWIDYLEVKKNGKRKLKRSTPIKIRKAYKEHLKREKEHFNNNTPVSK